VNELEIDIMLISERHFAAMNYVNFSKYTTYFTMHPDGTAHAGSATVICNNIKHHETQPYRVNHLQATNIVMDDWNGPITVSAI